ncbi:hypothetical protein AAL_03683 [Moelleriella libera RCEF 2490]|uniref:Uncharacterized protein n=1 Tax=Moelleriella libera RCEF 2490 TaxID=1081109 RepID=A0A168DGF8_9HYPO|nr:hypothetical protein AAL_03683 [Moelleriella libera RCEF 2490]
MRGKQRTLSNRSRTMLGARGGVAISTRLNFGSDLKILKEQSKVEGLHVFGGFFALRTKIATLGLLNDTFKLSGKFVLSYVHKILWLGVEGDFEFSIPVITKFTFARTIAAVVNYTTGGLGIKFNTKNALGDIGGIKGFNLDAIGFKTQLAPELELAPTKIAVEGGIRIEGLDNVYGHVTNQVLGRRISFEEAMSITAPDEINLTPRMPSEGLVPTIATQGPDQVFVSGKLKFLGTEHDFYAAVDGDSFVANFDSQSKFFEKASSKVTLVGVSGSLKIDAAWTTGRGSLSISMSGKAKAFEKTWDIGDIGTSITEDTSIELVKNWSRDMETGVSTTTHFLKTNWEVASQELVRLFPGIKELPVTEIIGPVVKELDMIYKEARNPYADLGIGKFMDAKLLGDICGRDPPPDRRLGWTPVVLIPDEIFKALTEPRKRPDVI